MPKVTLNDIASARTKMEKDLDDYEKDIKKLDTRKNKIMMEYRTIKEGLEEGNKEIEDLKKQVKTAYDTWQKMLGKLDRIKDDLQTINKEANATLPGLGQFETPTTKLMKELPNCGGDMKELKEMNDGLKGILRAAERLRTEYNNLLDETAVPPKDPPKPTLAIA